MYRQTFGKICASLRQDLFEITKGKSFSQGDLAKTSGLQAKHIGQIERGEKVHLDMDMIDKLADAFNLTTVERKRFFLLVNSETYRQKENEAQVAKQVHRETLDYMETPQAPVLLHDGLYRILALNDAYFKVYGLTHNYLNDIPNTDPTKYHIVRHIHDPESPVRAVYQSHLEAVGWKNASYWRYLSLAHRHTPLFQEIQTLLQSRYVHFAYLWGGLSNPFPKNDMGSLLRPFACDHPHFGRLEYARDHIRLATQPLEEPQNIDYPWHLLESID
ncbi:MAG: helix-turn-helix transcriptional regulator, partial [Chloroflexota bacterium]